MPPRWQSRRGLRSVGVFAAAALTVMLVLPLTSQRDRVASSASAERLLVRRQVAALFAGIPQHGVVLGQLAAPVTLQVFIDLEDHGDGTRWLDFMLPHILEAFGRTNFVRLEFHSFKTDTLNRQLFYVQQIASLAAGAQNLLWNYVTTFMHEQGREFTNYVTEEFVAGIAEQLPGLNLAEWEQSRTFAMAKRVETDLITAHKAGFHGTPAFRIGLTGGEMKNVVGRNVEIPHPQIYRSHNIIWRTLPSWRKSRMAAPVSLIDAIGLKKAVEQLI